MNQVLPFTAIATAQKMPSIKDGFKFAITEFKSEPEKYIAFSVISLSAPLVLGSIGFIAKFIGFILFIATPPLQTGTSAYYHHKVLTGKKEFSFFFQPYTKILQLAIFQVVALLGFFVIILPLTFWAVAENNNSADYAISDLSIPIQIFCFLTFLVVVFYAICITFVPYFIYFYNLPVKQAVKNSFAIIKPRWFWFFGLFLIFAGIMLAGFLCFVIGVLVAVPVVRLFSYYVFAEYTGLDAKK